MESIEKPRLSCKVCRGHDIERKITYGAPTTTASSGEQAVPGMESPYTHAWCQHHEVRPVRFSRVGGEEAPTDVACNVRHFVIAVLYKGAPPCRLPAPDDRVTQLARRRDVQSR
jgi:hypothetical protein